MIKIYQFDIIEHDIENIEKNERYGFECFITLDVKITKKIITQQNTPDFDIFFIEIFTDKKIVNIKCKFYGMELFELNEDEYKEIINNGYSIK